MVKKIAFFLVLLSSCICFNKRSILFSKPNNSNKIKIKGCYTRTMDGFEPDLFMVIFLFSNGVFYQPPLVREEEIKNINVEFKNRTENKDKTEWGTYIVDGDEIIFEGWSDDPCNTIYTQYAKILSDTTFLIYEFKYSWKKTPTNETFNYKRINFQMDSIHPKIKTQ